MKRLYILVGDLKHYLHKINKVFTTFERGEKLKVFLNELVEYNKRLAFVYFEKIIGVKS